MSVFSLLGGEQSKLPKGTQPIILNGNGQVLDMSMSALRIRQHPNIIWKFSSSKYSSSSFFLKCSFPTRTKPFNPRRIILLLFSWFVSWFISEDEPAEGEVSSGVVYVSWFSTAALLVVLPSAKTIWGAHWASCWGDPSTNWGPGCTHVPFTPARSPCKYLLNPHHTSQSEESDSTITVTPAALLSLNKKNLLAGGWVLWRKRRQNLKNARGLCSSRPSQEGRASWVA